MPANMRNPIVDTLAQLWTPAPRLIQEDLSGKVVLVVGANTGLGFEAAKHFASMNPAKLIVTARDATKGENAVLSIAKATKYRAENAVLDLSDFLSVKAFLDDFERTNSRLDIVILNAGVASFTYSQTKDGWETMVQVNHLSSSWIALRLLSLLHASGKVSQTIPRLVIVTSSIHYVANFDRPELLVKGDFLKQLSDKDYCTSKQMEGRYPESKLLNVLFTRAFSKHFPLQSTNVAINCVGPGFCSTGLSREATGLVKVIYKVMLSLFAYTPEQGSRHIVNAALGHRGQEKESHGSFNTHSEIRGPAPFVTGKLGQEFQDRLWVETLDILSTHDPKIAELKKSGVIPAQ